MVRWRLLITCPLIAITAAASLLVFLSVPGASAEGEETLQFCREPALAIPDGEPAGVTDTLVIPSNLTLASVDVGVTVNHEWAGDLVVSIRRDEGPEVTLLDRWDVSAVRPFGCGATLIAAQFADGGLVPTTCTPTLTGTVRPELPLALFAGQAAAGSWHLRVVDAESGMAGTVERWCVAATVAAAPRVAVSPPNVTAWVAPAMTRTVPLTVTNDGEADWQWGAAPVATGGALLLTDGFEGNMIPPPGWVLTTAQAAATWQLLDGTAHTGSQAAAVRGADDEQDEWLVSPPLYLHAAWLSHWTWGNATICRVNNRCDLQVWLLKEAGEAVLLGRADDAWMETGTWTPHAWELTPHLPASGSVRLAFRYVSPGGSSEARLDDVMVTGLVRTPACRTATPGWLKMITATAPLAPGAEMPASLVVDATGLVQGTYQGTACLPGNDPVVPLVPVTVTARVDPCVAEIATEPNLAIARGAGGEALLSWDAQSGSISFQVARGSRPYAEEPWLALPTGSDAAVDPAPGAAAFYRVVASNCSGNHVAASNRAGWLVTPLAASSGQAGVWSDVSLALDTGGELERASALAAAIPDAELLLWWDAAMQNFIYFAPPATGLDFEVKTGTPLLVLRNETAPGAFTQAGGVPSPGDVGFTMVGGTPCRWNHLSLPLEQTDIRNAQELAEAIRGIDSGAVEQLLVWEPMQQAFAYWIPAPVGGPVGMGTNFAVGIGGSTFVCLNRDVIWP
jgi:hypothetical protein